MSVEECEGCCRLLKLASRLECKHTHVGVSDIIGCCCKQCLIKMICKNTCPEHLEDISRCNHSQYQAELRRYEAKQKCQKNVKGVVQL